MQTAAGLEVVGRGYYGAKRDLSDQILIKLRFWSIEYYKYAEETEGIRIQYCLSFAGNAPSVVLLSFRLHRRL